MGVYDEEIALAKEMIADYGQAVILRQVTNGEPADEDKPWKPGAEITTDHTVRIVFLPDEQRGRESLRLEFGTSVATGNLIGLMAAEAVIPTLKDVIVRGDKHYDIRAIEPFAPNGDIIYYMLRFNL